MVVFQNELVDINYNQGNKFGIGVWHGNASNRNADLFKEAMIQIGDLIEQKKLTKWVGNMVDLEFISPDLQRWTNEEWFPRVLKLGVKEIAVVVSESALARMSVKQIMTKVGETENQYFDDVDKAVEWVKSK